MKKTWFERAVFYSWSCNLEKCCSYCYMSTLPKEKRAVPKLRSMASLLAETIICRELGWKYGFLSGGVGVLTDEKVIELLKNTNEIIREKVWINIGVLSEEQMKKFMPYIKGVVGTVEVLDTVLHRKICPSKPLEPVEEMFKKSSALGLENAMTLIIGLGETIDDFRLLKRFITQNKIVKIHIYGLNIQKGTIFEGTEPPSPEYQSEWIRLVRKEFPEIDIQCGIWADRASYVKQLLEAGADSISKFPALKKFGAEESFEIEKQAALAGREFEGTLTKLPDIEWGKKVNELSFGKELKEKIMQKLNQYLDNMGSTRT